MCVCSIYSVCVCALRQNGRIAPLFVVFCRFLSFFVILLYKLPFNLNLTNETGGGKLEILHIGSYFHRAQAFATVLVGSAGGKYCSTRTTLVILVFIHYEYY